MLLKSCCLRSWGWPCLREVMMDELQTREWREVAAFGMVCGGAESVPHLPRCPFGAGDCYPPHTARKPDDKAVKTMLEMRLLF